MKSILLYFLTLVCLSLSINGQLLDMKFMDISNKEKLSSSFVTCITQDTSGFIWIGTRDGLNRYDGYDIRVYLPVFGDSACLLSDHIQSLYSDTRGRVWIAMNNGVCRYNAVHDNFERIPFSFNPDIYEMMNIDFITGDREGKIYATNGAGIFLLDEKDQTFKEFLACDTGIISHFLFDEKNNIWISFIRGGGLQYYDRTSNTFTRFVHKKNDTNSLSSNAISMIELDDNYLWIATAGEGVNRYDTDKGVFKRYPYTVTHEGFVNYIYKDNDGRIWSCDMTGLKLFNDETGTFYGYYYNEEDEFCIKKSPNAIFQDMQGNYWTLHSPGGVGLRTLPKSFHYFNTNPSKFWHTLYNNISAINEDVKGNLWLANPFNGIDIFNWSEAKIIRYIHDPDDPHSLGNGATFEIFRDNNNKMWIGTNMGGLQYYDEKNKRFISYTHDDERPESIANNDVRSITEDDKGNLWLVTHGKGIDKFDRKNKVFHHYTHEKNNLSNDWAFQVLHDQRGNIWVATVWGLSVLKTGENNFNNYHTVVNDTTTISNNEIVCLYEDRQDQLWIGTAKGLNRYNYDTDNFSRYEKSTGDMYVSAITGDNKGNIWISTYKGLMKIDPVKKTYRRFDVADGLLSNEFNPRSVFKNNSNTLFFGSIKGAEFFNPDELVYNTVPPKVLISSFRLFNEEITDYGEHSILDKHISLTKKITLTHSQNVISFEFIALNMIHAEKNRYAYKMEGFDKSWIHAGHKREAFYTNLDPGDYIFRVKASNNDGYWNEEGATLYITILSPFYATWWFNLLVALFILILFASFYQLRTSQIRKKKKKLAQQVEQQTIELIEKNKTLGKQANDLNDTNTQLEERQQKIEEQSEELELQRDFLQKANAELKLLNNTKDKLFSIIAHDLRNPFNTILGFSNLLSMDYVQMNDEEKQNMADSINVASQRVYDLLENLLKWARTQTNEIKYQPVDVNIPLLINENISLLKANIKEKHIHLSASISNEIYAFADEDMIKTVVRNLLSNAIKFTPIKGEISITCEYVKDKVTVSITDTGIGIHKKQLKNLFKIDDNKSTLGTNGEKGSGIGLVLCKEFIERNKGKISVSSQYEKGSTFSFTLPAGKK